MTIHNKQTLKYSLIDLLWYEWIDNLALRRVHFLESDHYPQRMQELDDIANLQTKPEDPIIAQRPPFVPHPEMREIPPNVSLYSCSVNLLNISSYYFSPPFICFRIICA